VPDEELDITGKHAELIVYAMVAKGSYIEEYPLI